MEEQKIASKAFLKHLKENSTYLWVAFSIAVVYFIILRVLFPIPSFVGDSYTYLQVARDKNPISYRPVEYSKLISFFKAFSTSDVALIFAQYFSNVFANLFLFFTCTYFFGFKKATKLILFVLLICNPFYLLFSNYILADSFFTSFTVLWFTLFIWIMHKPFWYYMVIEIFVLLVLFELRYNAIIFPVFMALAIILSKQSKWKKALSISANFLMIGCLILNTINKTEEFTGTRTFSSFSGWQLANNAIHILRHVKADTKNIEDKDVKNIADYTQTFLDTASLDIDANIVSAGYMWNKNEPLKEYLNLYKAKYKMQNYFKTWTALGPIYNKFGKTIIFQKPIEYLRYFVLPNTREYFLPQLEAYQFYCENHDTIGPIAKTFYHYSTNKTGLKHPAIYAVVFAPWKYLFAVVNLLFIVLALVYFFTKRYKKEAQLFNFTLLCYSFFYLGNFIFIVFLAPSVLRYHIFIITLAYPIILYLFQSLIKPKQAASSI